MTSVKLSQVRDCEEDFYLTIEVSSDTYPLSRGDLMASLEDCFRCLEASEEDFVVDDELLVVGGRLKGNGKATNDCRIDISLDDARSHFLEALLGGWVQNMRTHQYHLTHSVYICSFQ